MGKVTMAGVMAFAMLAGSAQAELKIGDKAPDFQCKGTDNKDYNFEAVKEAEVVVIAVTCNSCPVAVDYEDRFIEFTKAYEGKKVQFIAINCNNASEDLEKMAKRAEAKGFNFPYVFDEAGKAAGEYGAKVTPTLYVLDKQRKLAYKGSFDDNNRNPKVPYVANAVDALLAGKTPEVTDTKAFGCGVRVKKN